MDIPSDNYAAAAAARDRALDLRAALRRMPVSSTTAGPSMDTEGDTVMTRVASTGFAGKGKGKAKIQGPVPGRRGEDEELLHKTFELHLLSCLEAEASSVVCDSTAAAQLPTVHEQAWRILYQQYSATSNQGHPELSPVPAPHPG
ncbi:hypothetical protein E4U31_000335 [Claviceps sp. LM219 group G6]|nr:hypothetical protein E4U31_000335 [Claviceps sp. LM219 group G6]